MRRIAATGASFGLVALVLLLALTGLAPSALAFRGHAFSSDFGWGVSDGKGESQVCATECKLGIAGAESGQFSAPSNVAVNEATGHIYVLDQGNARIQVFGHDEKFISQFDGSQTPATAFSFGTFALSGGIAVDNSCFVKKLSGAACAAADPSNGDVYVTDPGNKVVDKFSAEGVYLGQLEEDCGKASCPAFEFIGAEIGFALAGVGVDTSGAVWVYTEHQDEEGVNSDEVDNFTNGEPSVFATARQLNNVGSAVCPGFAVDSEDDLYARRAANLPQCTQSSRVFEFASSGGSLLTPFAEEETSAVAVDLVSDEVFLDNVSSVGAFSSSAAPQERFGAGDLVDGAGLSIDHENATDSTVYVADGSANRIDVFGPEPPGAPTIEGESVIDVTANSARLQGEVNSHGSSTQFHFEYGRCVTPSTCASSPYEQSIPVPEQVAGADFEIYSVSANPQDLQAATTYHFRLLAHNELSPAGVPAKGEEQTFTTQIGGVFELPDGRAWEMVSPPQKFGAGFVPIGAPGVVQAAASGDAISYLATAPSEAQPQGNAANSQVISTRSGGAWSSRDIAPPHDSATGQPVGTGQEYRFFSSDLSQGVVQRFGAFTPSLSPAASEQTPYLTSLSQSCLNAALSGCYDPLVSACPEEGEECPPAIAEHANAAPGSVFGEEGLCPGPEKGVCGPVFVGATRDLGHVVLKSKAPLLGGSVKGGLYEWSGGRLALASVLPGGEGGGAVVGELGERGGRNARGAISVDGSRVVWMTIGAQPRLYLYEAAKEESIRLDAGLSGTPEFQLASADTSKVLFTDGGDLYEYDAAGEELHRLTEGAEVIGRLGGAGEDGSFIYFVANGALTGGAVHGDCSGNGFTTAHQCNLYVLHEGKIGLVAVLSGEDDPDWNPELNRLVTRVSANGRYLAFMSNRPLSGYDNRDAVSGRRDEEVFIYDANGAGSTACASCDPTGARPRGQEVGTLAQKTLVGGDTVWQRQQWLAANIPSWTPYKNGQALYQSRFLSNSGRLFFNSHEALSPQDVNGTWDVYEYEPPSAGDCSASSPSFGERSGGCVALISSGTSPEESGFLDASEDGSDVFFLSAAKLTRADKDTALDVYDAHVCSAGSPCIPEPAAPPPPCSTEASCRPAPAPQPEIFGFPASATFSGTGNLAPTTPTQPKPKSAAQIRAEKLARALKACHAKKNKHQRKACEKQAQRKYGPVGKTKNSNRRAG
jgi:DNA-binding beta-propeller fold protein YncE